MEIPKIHESEYRFCLILWEQEPVSAAQLAKLCLAQLGWKRTTTYTVIKRLGERGVLKNENGIVTSLVSKDEAQACEIDELVEKKFEGSLPAFVAAFTKRQDLSREDLDEVQRMIDRIRKGGAQ
ncbi:MAG: BlaI/MecI/CopY family transcriptional regulator [Ruminococcaceae bacterium]|nr:BlaI/MecI/CopY family transcriptional regulator [Oscillospiraceae bacterium]